jgi:hypothetical protein
VLERFNFFDVYAYLLPGLAVIGLAWVPYVLLGATLPTSALTGALALVAVAYVAGHALQTFAKDFWKSEVSWLKGKREYPSKAVLDDEDTTLPKELKTALVEHLKLRFKFEPQKAHDLALRLCRTSLKRSQNASYAEQFQGMYNFLRGSATALLFASVYYLGWYAEAEVSHAKYELNWPLIVLASTALVACRQAVLWGSLFKQKGGRLDKVVKHAFVTKAYQVGLLAISFGAGGALAVLRGNVDFGFRFLALPAGAVVLLVQFVTAYHSFARDFAATVFRDYWALEGSLPRKPLLEPLEMD